MAACCGRSSRSRSWSPSLPGPATALVIRSALRGGRRAAFATIAANSVCVLPSGALSVLGISALVATSEAAFAVLKIAGAVVLVYLGRSRAAARRARRGGRDR